MDIDDITSNLFVGFLVLLGIFVLFVVAALVSLYADWLEFIMMAIFLVVAFEIGDYIRGKRK